MALLSQDDNSQKITQSYCQYGPGSPDRNCGICHHYTGNGCEIVQDPIRPEMVCRFFCPKQGGGLLGGQGQAMPQQGGPAGY